VGVEGTWGGHPGHGADRLLGANWELSAARRTTGIPNITVSRPSNLPSPVAGVLLPAVSVLARSHIVQRRAEAGTTGAAPTPHPTKRSRVWARAWDPEGRSATATLEAGEDYGFSAESAVSAVEAVLASPAAGAFTPGALLGADFALRIPETRRDEAHLEQTKTTERVNHLGD
jgi:hypothetical protein